MSCQSNADEYFRISVLTPLKMSFCMLQCCHYNGAKMGIVMIEFVYRVFDKLRGAIMVQTEKFKIAHSRDFEQSYKTTPANYHQDANISILITADDHYNFKSIKRFILSLTIYWI